MSTAWKKMMARKGEVAFHGTTERAWRKRVDGEETLYLVNDLEEAAQYAYHTGEQDELDGIVPRPIILAIPISKLEGLTFGPDWGWSGATGRTTWKQSFEEVGSFSVTGDVEAYKKLFTRVPKREWPDL